MSVCVCERERECDPYFQGLSVIFLYLFFFFSFVEFSYFTVLLVFAVQ